MDLEHRVHRLALRLQIREVHPPHRRRAQVVVLHIADDTHDGKCHRILANPLADRGASRKVEPGSGLVEQHDLRRAIVVVVAEFATLQEPGTDRVHVVGSDLIVVDERILLGSRGEPLRGDRRHRLGTAKDAILRIADGGDTGKRREPAVQIADERRAARALVATRRDVHLDDEQPVAIEARIPRLQGPKAAHEQTRADQQHEAERDLRGDEEPPDRNTLAARADRAATAADRARVRAHRRREVHARGAKRGREAEQRDRQHGHR